MKPLFISYWTSGPYEEYGRRLVKSLSKHMVDFDYVITPRVAFSGWIQACAYKANVIKEFLITKQPRPIVWLDADATVEQYPSLFFELDCDVAARFFNGDRQVGHLGSGTLYFANNARVMQIMNDWLEVLVKNPKMLDQDGLHQSLRMHPDAVIHELPPEYNFIFDTDKAEFPSLKPVILQHQASRKHR